MRAEVLKLVETVSEMVAGKTQANLRMKAFLEASADQAEQDEPGNKYSQELYQVLSLLDRGVPVGQLRQHLQRNLPTGEVRPQSKQ